MDKLQILVAHERPVIGQAIRRVLEAQGLRAEVLFDGDRVAEALKAREYDGLVLDVALPGAPVHELVELARTGVALPVKAVVLVASVFRRTSYKRKPQQLYGADDYVEIHHLGEQLASKLWRLLGADPSGVPGLVEAEAALATQQAEPDEPPADAAAAAAADSQRRARLAELLVADLVLYSGDRLLAAESLPEARAALAPELEQARLLLRPLGRFVADPAPAADAQTTADAGPAQDDPVDAALAALLRSLAPEGAWT